MGHIRYLLYIMYIRISDFNVIWGYITVIVICAGSGGWVLVIIVMLVLIVDGREVKPRSACPAPGHRIVDRDTSGVRLVASQWGRTHWLPSQANH